MALIIIISSSSIWSLVLSVLIMTCLVLDFSGLILFGFTQFLKPLVYVFHQICEIFSHYFFKYFFSEPHSFSFPSETLVTQILNISVLSYRSPRFSSFIQVFCLFVSLLLRLSNSCSLIVKFTHSFFCCLYSETFYISICSCG